MAKEERKKLYDEAGNLIYEGYTVNDKPSGEGKAYYPDGTVYQEGIFGIKGLLEGKEYYKNGNLRFDGKYELNHGYGPNYPKHGVFKSEDGSVTYEGEIKCSFGGVGYRTVEEPKEFGPIVQKESPSIPVLTWDEA